jgi:hypothetical protein
MALHMNVSRAVIVRVNDNAKAKNLQDCRHSSVNLNVWVYRTWKCSMYLTCVTTVGSRFLCVTERKPGNTCPALTWFPAGTGGHLMEKLPCDISVALERIEQAVQPWPKAALFQLAEEGYRSVFEQLVACIISIRTYDEVTMPVSRKLFAQARTPAQMGQLSWEELDTLISPCNQPLHFLRAQSRPDPGDRARSGSNVWRRAALRP